MKKLYKISKSSQTGDNCVCPSCRGEFVKKTYNQAFCGTICKDKYWNTITPKKRNNTTRISPASATFMKNRKAGFGVTFDSDGNSI